MEEKGRERVTVCKCPYCDADITVVAELPPICQPCSITIVTCGSCGGAAKEGAEECPHCGEPMR